MKNKKHVKLSEADRLYLEELLSKGNLPVKTYRRAQGLLFLDQGETYTAVGQRLNMTKQTVSVWAQNYRDNGLAMLADKPRPGRPNKISSVDEAAITALACSDPPPGCSQWSLRLLADYAVELIEADSISYGEVRRILKKTNSSPT